MKTWKIFWLNHNIKITLVSNTIKLPKFIILYVHLSLQKLWENFQYPKFRNFWILKSHFKHLLFLNIMNIWQWVSRDEPEIIGWIATLVWRFCLKSVYKLSFVRKCQSKAKCNWPKLKLLKKLILTYTLSQ